MIIRIKTSSKSIFDSYMALFQPHLETCPICASTGNCHIHDYYDRSIIDFIAGRQERASICILMVFCDSCQHAHAVLPEVIIPYSSFSLFFVLRILAEYFAGLYTREQLCERFDISANQLRKWIALWISHKRQWLGLLDDASSSDLSFLKELVTSGCYSSFSMSWMAFRHFPSYDKRNIRRRSFAMSKDTETLKHDAEVTQFRFALIVPVIQGLFPDASAAAYFKRVTASPLTLPDGSSVAYSYKTLEKWKFLYASGGLDALMPNARSDKGIPRSLDEDAIATYGIPDKLYVDNGCSYSNEQLSMICVSLDILLLHTRVRDGASRGKVERHFRTLKERWLYTLDINSISSLAQFDSMLRDYMRSYNTSFHRGIGVFTARPGMGKSYALRCFASGLNPSLYHMEYLCLSTISVSDFYK